MTNPGAISATAPPLLADIQMPVRAGLDQVLAELRRMVISDFGMIEEVNEYLLFMRGKLFRPTLLLLSNQIGDRPDDSAVTVAAVVELIHLATLVHDDAVDHSALRRGQPTVNSLWTHQVAVIMGDYFYSRAVTELAKIGSLEAVGVLAQAANAMSVGEMRQLTSYEALEFGEEDYHRLIAAKTASLMSAACELGSLVGDDRHRDPLARFGRNLGLAFQIADDLLDYTGTEAVTGKPTGHDLRERKVTLPLIGALKSASRAELSEIQSLFSRVDPSEDEIGRVIEIVRELGGIEYAERKALDFAQLAERALDDLPEGPALEGLVGAVGYAVGRTH